MSESKRRATRAQTKIAKERKSEVACSQPQECPQLEDVGMLLGFTALVGVLNLYMIFAATRSILSRFGNEDTNYCGVCLFSMCLIFCLIFFANLIMDSKKVTPEIVLKSCRKYLILMFKGHLVFLLFCLINWDKLASLDTFSAGTLQGYLCGCANAQ